MKGGVGKKGKEKSGSCTLARMTMRHTSEFI